MYVKWYEKRLYSIIKTQVQLQAMSQNNHSQNNDNNTYYPFMDNRSYYPYYCQQNPQSYPYAPHDSYNSFQHYEEHNSGEINNQVPPDFYKQELDDEDPIVKVQAEHKPQDKTSDKFEGIQPYDLPQAFIPQKSQVLEQPKPNMQKYKTRYTVLKVRPANEIKLNFRIKWQNENRNIVPNLINQMISYIQKKIKSQKLVRRIFAHIPHDATWTQHKFYLYMKKIKDTTTHYLNEQIINRFLQIHEPKCELFEYEEQLFYMQVARIAIIRFLQEETVLISLTSSRMSESKRKMHLIARQAILQKIIELCQQAKN